MNTRQLIIFVLLPLLWGDLITQQADANSYVFKALHSFCAQPNCTDGQYPYGLAVDQRHNLIGVTAEGSPDPTAGTLFEMLKAKKAGFKVTHNFCSSCDEGAQPVVTPIIAKGNFIYGATDQSLFRSSYDGDLDLLYRCSGDCAPGGPITFLTYQGAQSGIPYDGKSPLFGTTRGGGSKSGGTVFEYMPKQGEMKVLYEFCTAPCADGNAPTGIVLDDAGNIFGTTTFGGSQNSGIVFELVPNAKKTKWTESVLYEFCGVQFCADGQYPYGSLAIDGGGNVVGATQGGGNDERGAVFSVAPAGAKSQETVLHSFCNGCEQPDGSLPYGGISIGPSGELFGTTSTGGAFGGGIVFGITGSSYEILYDFCSGKCQDGSTPMAPLTLDAKGELFGTTTWDGVNKAGTVFELEPK